MKEMSREVASARLTLARVRLTEHQEALAKATETRASIDRRREANEKRVATPLAEGA